MFICNEFICNKCGKIFEEPIIEYDDPSPEGVSLSKGYYKYYYCPYCGSDDMEEYYECED